MHPFLHPDPAHEPTHASAAGLLAQSVRWAWYPKVLGSIPTFSTKHIEAHRCSDDAGGFFAAGRARFRA